jgi:hypothetical protein
MQGLHSGLSRSGFSFFPTESDPPTYRSATVSSTIDFTYHRNLVIEDPEVAKIYIAQHRPLSAKVCLQSHDSSQKVDMDVAFG